MEVKRFNAGDWLISEGGNPAYFFYRLKSGKVSIYSGGEKISSIEVRNGDRPKVLGIVAALGKERVHKASIKADTQLEVELFYIDQLREHIDHQVTKEAKVEISRMIETIILDNEVMSLRKRVSGKAGVTLKVPQDLPANLSLALKELSSLYKNAMMRTGIAH